MWHVQLCTVAGVRIDRGNGRLFTPTPGMVGNGRPPGCLASKQPPTPGGSLSCFLPFRPLASWEVVGGCQDQPVVMKQP